MADTLTAGRAVPEIADCGRIVAPRWAVFASKPQAEFYATTELTRAGYRTYLPLIAIHRRDPVIKTKYHVVRVPMFRGYGFVWIDGGWVPARYTSGVRDLLMGMNGQPAAVPTSLIESLQAEDAERCELTEPPLPVLPIGSPVMILAGPLSGNSATVMETQSARVQVNAALFGRYVPVWLDRSAVEITNGETHDQGA